MSRSRYVGEGQEGVYRCMCEYLWGGGGYNHKGVVNSIQME